VKEAIGEVGKVSGFSLSIHSKENAPKSFRKRQPRARVGAGGEKIMEREKSLTTLTGPTGTRNT
jgi:hypothetical protein